MSNCPKCKRENTRGTDAHGWATCSHCGFLWREVEAPRRQAPAASRPPEPTADPGGEATDELVLEHPSSPGGKPPADKTPNPDGAAGPPPAGVRKAGGGTPGSDEYLPDDATDLSLRALSTARLTAHQERARRQAFDFMAEAERQEADREASSDTLPSDHGSADDASADSPSAVAAAPGDVAAGSSADAAPVGDRADHEVVPDPPVEAPDEASAAVGLSPDDDPDLIGGRLDHDIDDDEAGAGDDPRSALPDLDLPGAKLVGASQPTTPGGGKMSWPEEAPTVAEGAVHCPICGHGFQAKAQEDGQAMCPQCHSRFDVRSGVVAQQDDSEDVFTTDDDTVIGRILGGCAIDRKIGEGGMGTVFHGRQLSLDRDVAVKILAPELTVQSHFMHRFTQEARSLAQINHPNILHVYDFGEDHSSSLYYMIMEFVDGEDLADVLHRRHHMPETECLDMIYQAANGLRAAAAKGIIHRDIKPDNLMLTKGEQVVKVTDFGLAKNAATITQTNAKIRVGTPAFMSPEQCDGHKLDARSDMYSLGCTAYVALTGRLPYEGETPFAIMLKHKADPVPHVRDRMPAVDPDVDALIYRMMGKDREDRWETWDGLIDQVKAMLDRHGGPTMVYSKSETGLPTIDDPFVSTEPPGRASPPPAPQPPDLSLGEAAPRTVSAEQDLPQAPPQTPAEVPVLRQSSDDPASAQRRLKTPPRRSSALLQVPDELQDASSSSSDHLSAARSQRGPASDIFPDEDSGTGNTARKPASARLEADSDLLVRKRIGSLQERSSRIIALVAEGDRLYARRRYGKAITSWESVVQDIGDLREREHCYQKIADARAAMHRRRRRRSLIGLLLLLPLLAAALFVGLPIGHGMWADRALAEIVTIDERHEQRVALERFLAGPGRPVPWFEQVFQRGYELPATKRAEDILQNMESVRAIDRQRQRDEALIAKLHALYEDASVSWMALEAQLHAAAQRAATPVAKRRVEELQAEVEPRIEAIRQAYDGVETALAAGRFGDACRLGRRLAAEHPRAGTLLQRLPLPVEIQAVDNRGRPLAGVTVAVDEVVSVDEPPIAYRMPAQPVRLTVSRSGYLSHQAKLTVDKDEADADSLRLRVELRPGRAWQHGIDEARSAWYQLLADDGSVGLLGAHQLVLVGLDSGELIATIRRDALDGRSNASLRWSRFVLSDEEGLLLGSMDGAVWAWTPGEGEPQRRYQSNLPVLTAARFPLALADGEALVVAVDGVRGAVVECLVDGQPTWQGNLGQVGQQPEIFHRVGMTYVLGDEQLHVYEEAGRGRGKLSLGGTRLGGGCWLHRDLMVVPTDQGLEYIHIWPEGDATISRGLPLPGQTFDGMDMGQERLAVMLDQSLLVAYRQGRQEQVLQEDWRITAPEGRSWAMPPVVRGQQMVLTDQEGRIAVHSMVDGAVVRVYEHGTPLQCPPLLLDHHIVIFDQADQFIAYHLPD